MTKRLTAKVGEYQKDGQTKGRYVDLGVILSNNNGEYILLDPSVSLAGVLAMQSAMTDRPRDKVMVSIFDNDRNGGQRQGNDRGYGGDQSGYGAGGRPGGGYDDPDGIPFDCERRV